MYKSNIQPLYILINREDVDSKFFKNFINLFTFNKFIINDKERSKVKHIFPDAKKTSFESQLLFLKTQEIKNLIFKKILKNNYFKNIKNIKELLDPFDLSCFLLLQLCSISL